jgi:hypothetical protein
VFFPQNTSEGCFCFVQREDESYAEFWKCQMFTYRQTDAAKLETLFLTKNKCNKIIFFLLMEINSLKGFPAASLEAAAALKPSENYYNEM